MSANMALDDIIQQNKKSKSGRAVGGFRSDGGAKSTGSSSISRSYGRFSSSVPSGKWKHDKFAEINRPQRESGPRFSSGGALSASSGNPNKIVHLNLSNLAPSVVSADIEELFEQYDPDVCTVHFNELGQSLGTGCVTLKRKDANRAAKDFSGVSLDEQLLKMVIVDDSNGTGSIKNRLQFVQGSRPTQRRSEGFVDRRSGGKPNRGAKRSSAHFLDRIVDDDDDKPARRGGRPARGVSRGGRGGRNGREKKVQKSVAELDAELESYMNKTKSNDIDMM